MKRKPLAVGNVYVFPNYPKSRFIVKYICFPDTPNYDGGFPGVSLKWIGLSKSSYFYPFNCEKSFWEDFLFRNAVSK